MKPTRALIERAKASHADWLKDFLTNGTTQSALEVLDDHDCKLGTFLASVDREFKMSPAYRETYRIHVELHYYCSVMVTLKSLSIPMHEFLENKITLTSQTLNESLSQWEL